MIADKEENFLDTEIMETDYLNYNLRNKNESIIPSSGLLTVCFFASVPCSSTTFPTNLISHKHNEAYFY